MQNIFINADLAVRFESRGSDVLFVTFADLEGDSKAPFGYKVVKELGCDHLSFVAKAGNRYQSLDITRFKTFIGELEKSYASYVFYGFSSGAHAALYYAGTLENENVFVLALAPNNPLHPVNSDVRAGSKDVGHDYLFPKIISVDRALIIYDPRHFYDSRFVNTAYERRNNCALVYTPHTGHGVLQALVEAKVARPILTIMRDLSRNPPVAARSAARQIMPHIGHLLRTDRGSCRSIYNLGEILFRKEKYRTLDRMYRKYLPNAEEILQDNPIFAASVWDRYASVCMHLKEFGQAINYICKARTCQPHNNGYKAFEVEILTEAGELTQASALIEAHLETDPMDPIFHHRAAVLLLRMGLIEKAVHHSGKAVEFAPGAEWLERYLEKCKKISASRS